MRIKDRRLLYAFLVRKPNGRTSKYDSKPTLTYPTVRDLAEDKAHHFPTLEVFFLRVVFDQQFATA